MTPPTADPRLDDYALHSADKLRYGDTDRQGHVNNAVGLASLDAAGRGPGTDQNARSGPE